MSERERRPLRVCFPFVGDSVGGSHVSAVSLIRGLDRERVEPLVAVHEEDGPLLPFLDGHGIPSVAAPRTALVGEGSIAGQIAGMARAAPPVARFLKKHAIAAVHTNDARMHLTWGLASRLAGARFIWHQRSAARSRRLSVFSRLATHVPTISNYCREGFPGGMKRRAVVVPEPVEIEGGAPERPAARAMILEVAGAPANAHLVAFVANLREQKRPLVFVEAIARLAARLGAGKIRGLMIGEVRPPHGNEVETHIRNLGLEDVCLLVGPKFPVAPWIAGCDALLAPAVNEGFGRALVEAMLAGTPVIAANHGGHREVVEEGVTGLLVQPDDPDAFAAALAPVLENPERARGMTEAARRMARVTHSVARHVELITALYTAARTPETSPTEAPASTP